MSGLKKLEETLKKKIALNDYKPEAQKDGIEEKQEIKHKVTFYLPESVLRAFDKIYAERILQGNKIDRSALISEIIKSYCQER